MSGVSGVVYRPFGDGTVSVALADGGELEGDHLGGSLSPQEHGRRPLPRGVQLNMYHIVVQSPT